MFINKNEKKIDWQIFSHLPTQMQNLGQIFKGKINGEL